MGNDLQADQSPRRPLERSRTQNAHPLAAEPHPDPGPHGNILQNQQVPLSSQADPDRARADMDADSQAIQGSQKQRPGCKRVEGTVHVRTEGERNAQSHEHGGK